MPKDRHPRLAGFDEFYAREIEPGLLAREDKRRQLVKTCALIVAATVAVIVVVQLLAHFVFEANFFVRVIAFAMVPAFFGGGGIWMLAKFFNLGLKLKIMPKLAAFADLTYAIKPEAFPLAAFTELDILPRHHRSALEDGLAGNHNGVNFALAEATLRRRSGSSDGKENYKTVFHGLLFVFDVKKRFSGMAVAVRDSGPLKKLFDTRRAQRVALEDPRFEKLFEVYGTDQVEARFLFTPTLMERIVALGEVIGDPAPHIAFHDGRLLVAAKVKGNRFEAGSIFVPMNDRRRIDNILEELTLVFEIVETLEASLKADI